MNTLAKDRRRRRRPAGLLSGLLGVLVLVVAPVVPAAGKPSPAAAGPTKPSAPEAVPTEGQNLDEITDEELDALLEAAIKNAAQRDRAAKPTTASKPKRLSDVPPRRGRSTVAPTTSSPATTRPVRRSPASRPTTAKLPTTRPVRTTRGRRPIAAKPPTTRPVRTTRGRRPIAAKPSTTRRATSFRSPRSIPRQQATSRPVMPSRVTRSTSPKRSRTTPTPRGAAPGRPKLTIDQIIGHAAVEGGGTRPGSPRVVASAPAAGTARRPAGTQPVTVKAGGRGEIPGTRIPEERVYQFSYADTAIKTVIEDVGRMSGLSILGLNKLPPKPLLNYVSPAKMTYAETMALLNEILGAEYGCFVMRTENHLIVDKLTGFRKYITHIYPDRTTFEASKVAPWEFVLVYHTPKKEAAADLMNVLRKHMPDYVLFQVMPGTNTMELSARASDIHKFFELLDLEIQRRNKPGDEKKEVRPFKAFEVVNMQAQEALKILQQLGVTQAGAARPIPTPTRSRKLTRTPLQTAAGQDLNRVDITVDSRLNKILVRAKQETLDEIAKYLKLIDVEQPKGEQRTPKIIELKHAMAVDLANTLQQILRLERAAGTSGRSKAWWKEKGGKAGAGKDGIQIIPEVRRNALIVMANPKEHERVAELVAEFDTPGKSATLEEVELKFARADQVQNTVTMIMQQRHTATGVRTPKAQKLPFSAFALPIGNTLLLSGTQEDLNEAKEIIARLDVKESGESQEHIVRLKNATPSKMATVLQQMYAGQSTPTVRSRLSRLSRFRSSRYRRSTPIRSGTQGGAMRFIPLDESQILIVLAPEAFFTKKIEPQIAALDKEMEVLDSERVVTIDIAEGDAREIAATLTRMYGRGFQSKSGRKISCRFEADPRLNMLIVSGNDEVIEQVNVLLKKLDVPPTQDPLAILDMENADANQVLQVINATLSRDQRNSVQLTVEPTTNSIIMRASKGIAESIKKIAQELDDRLVEKGSVREVFDLEHASATDVQRVVQTLLNTPGAGRGRGRRNPMTNIKFVPLGSKSLLVEAPKEKLPEIRQLIAQVDTEKMKASVVKIFRVGENVDLRQIVRPLQTLLKPKGASISSEPNSGLLIVTAPPTVMDDVSKEIEKVTKEFEGSIPVTQTYTPEFIPGATLYGKVQQLMPFFDSKISRRSRSNPIAFYYDGPTNKLFMKGTQDQVKLAMELIKQFDVEGSGSEAGPQMVKLELADAATVAGQLMSAIAERRRIRGKRRVDEKPFEANADTRLNTVFLRGEIQDVEFARKLIAEYEDEVKTNPIERKHVELKYATANVVRDLVNRLFLPPQQKGRKRDPALDEIKIEELGSDLIVEAPKSKLDELVRFIEDVCDTPNAVSSTPPRKTETYKPQYIHGGTLQSKVQTLLPQFASVRRLGKKAAAMPVQFFFDAPTNQLFITATDQQMEVVMGLIEKFDVPGATPEPELIRLEYAEAGRVAAQLTQWFSERRRVRGSRTRVAEAPFEAIPETRLNALFLKGEPADIEAAKQVIAEFEEDVRTNPIVREKIELQNATPAVVQQFVQTFFMPPQATRGRRKRDTSLDLIRIQPLGPDIIVEAPQKKMDELKKFITEQADTPKAMQTTPPLVMKIYEPQYINGSTLMPKVMQLMPQFAAQKRISRRSQSAQIQYYYDAPSNQLFVTATEEQMELLFELFKKFDVPEQEGKDRPELIKLEFAEATWVATQLNQWVAEQKSRRSRAERHVGELPFQAIADTRLNAVFLKGESKDIEIAKTLITELETEVKTNPIVRKKIKLENATPGVVQQLIQTTFLQPQSKRKKRDKTLDLVRIEPLGQDIVIVAPKNKLEEIEKFVHEEADTLEAMQSTPPVVMKVYEPQYINGSTLMPKVMSLLPQFAQQKRLSRRSTSVSVNYHYEAASNKLFITATEEQMKLLFEMFKEFDVPEAEGKDKPELVKLAYAEAGWVAGQLSQWMAQQKSRRSRAETRLNELPFQAIADTRLNAVFLKGEQKDIEAAKELITEFEDEVKTNPIVRKKIELKYATPGVVSQLIQTLFLPPQSKRRHRDKTLDQIRIEPLGTDVVVVAPQKIMDKVEAFIREDADTPKAMQTTPPTIMETYEPQYVNGSTLMPKVMQLLPQFAEQRRLSRKATATPVRYHYDGPTNKLFITATEEQMKLVKELITEFDVPEAQDKEKPILVKLEHADATWVSSQLMQWISQQKTLRTRAQKVGELPFQAIASVRLNAVYLKGEQADIEAAQELIGKFEEEMATNPIVREKIELQYATPQVVQSLVQTLFMPPQVTRGKRRHDLSLDLIQIQPLGTDVLVVAPQDKMEELKTFITEQADTPKAMQTTPPTIMETYEPQYVNGSTLMPKVMQLLPQFAEQRRLSRKATATPVRYHYDAPTNKLFITATEEQMKLVKELITEFDVPEARDKEKPILVRLEHADAAWVASQLTQWISQQKTLRTRVQKVGELPFQAIASVRLNAVYLKGEQADIEAAQELIGKFEEEMATNPIVREKIELQYATPQVVQSLVQTLFMPPRAAGRQGKHDRSLDLIQIQPLGTDVLVVAPQDKMEELKTFITEQADTPKAMQDTPPLVMKTYKPQYVNGNTLMPKVMQLLPQFAKQRRLSRKATAAAVSYYYDSATNQLFITATEEQMKVVMELITQFDIPEAEGRDKPELIKLEFAEATWVATQLTQYMAQQKSLRSRSEQRVNELPFQVIADVRLNAVFVKGEPKDIEAAKALIVEFENEVRENPIVREKIELKFATPAVVQNLVQTMYLPPQTGRRRRDPSLDRIKIQPIGTDVIVEAPKEEMEELRTFITDVADTPNAAQDTPPQITETYKPQFVNGNTLSGKVNQLLPQFATARKIGRKAAAMPVRMYYDAPTNQLFITATEQQMEVVMDLIKRFDDEKAIEAKPELVKLEFAEAQWVATQLAQWFTREQKLRRGRSANEAVARLPFEAIPDKRLNAVFLKGELEDIEGAKALITEFEAEVKENPIERERVELQYATAGDVVQLVQTLFMPPQSGRGRRKRDVELIKVQPLGTDVLVEAPRDKLQELITFIKDTCDHPNAMSSAPRQVTETFEPQYVDGSTLIPKIQALLPQMASRIGKKASAVPVQLYYDRPTNQFFVTATEQQMKVVMDLVAKFDVPQVTADKVLKIKLEYAEAERVAEQVKALWERNKKLQFKTRRLSEVEPVIVAEPSINTVFLVAEGDAMTAAKLLIETIEEEIEKNPIIKKEVELSYTNPAKVIELVGQLYKPKPDKRRRGRAEEPMKIIAIGPNVMIEAPTDQVAEIEALITETIDRPERDTQSIKQYKIEDVDMGKMVSQIAGLFPKMKLTWDPKASLLIVSGPNERFAAVEKTIQEIQELAKPVLPVTQIYIPKFVQAQTLSSLVKELLPTTSRVRGKVARGVTLEARIVAEPRTNRLFISAPPDEMEAVQQVLEMLDVETGNDDAFKEIQLENAPVEQVASKLREFFQARSGLAEKRKEQVDEVLIVPEPTTNKMLISATDKDFTEAQRLALEIDKEYLTKEIVERTFQLQYVTANQIVPVLQAFYTPNRNKRKRFTSVAEQEMTFSTSGNTIVVRAAKDKLAKIEALIQQLDVPKSEELEVRTYALDAMAAQQAATTLSQLMKNWETRQGQAQPTVLADPTANILFVSATATQFERIDKLIETMKSGASEAQIIVRQFPLKHAQASQLASMIAQLLNATAEQKLQGMRRRRSGKIVTVTPEARGNRLIVAAPGPLMEEAERLITELDNEIDESAFLERRIFTIQYISPGEVVTALNTFFLPKGAKRSATVQDVNFVATGTSVVVEAPKSRMPAIEKLITDLDSADSANEIRTYKVEGADVVQMAKTLTQMLNAQMQGKRGRAAQQRITITGDATSEMLLVSAPTERFADVESLIEKMREGATEIRTVIRNFPLTHAQASQLAGIVTPLLQARATELLRGKKVRGRGKPVTVTPEVRGNRLVIAAPTALMEEAEKLIRELDGEVDESVTHDRRIFPLQYATPQEVVQALQMFFTPQGAKRNAAVQDVLFVATPTSVVVDAPKVRMPAIEKLVQDLDSAETTNEIRTYKLEGVEVTQVAGTLTQMLNAQLQGKRGRAAQQRITITGDATTEMLFVSAPTERFEEIEKLIETVKTGASEVQTVVRNFILKNAQASQLVPMITSMLKARAEEVLRGKRRKGRGAPVTVNADERANRLVIAAPSQLMTEAEALIKQLDDEIDESINHTRRIFQLKHAVPQEVVTALQTFFVPKGAKRGATTLEVRFIATATAVVVDAPKAKMEAIAALIDDLDSEDVKHDIKSYTFSDGDVTKIAKTLTQLVNVKGAGRKQTAQQITIAAEPSSRMIFVSAPKERFVEIEGLMEQVKAGLITSTTTVRYFKLENADADELAQLVQPMLDAKAKELAPPGAKTGYTVVVTPEERNNRLVISAPGEVLEVADAMIRELDNPTDPDDSVMLIVELTRGDAADIASVVERTLAATQGHGTPRAVGRKKGRKGRKAAAPAAGGTVGSGKKQVTLVPSAGNNSIILTGHPEEVARAHDLIKQLDETATPKTGILKIYKIEEGLDVDEIADMAIAILSGGEASGAASAKGTSDNEFGDLGMSASGPRRAAGMVISTDYDNNTMLVSASPEQHAIIDDVIEQELKLVERDENGNPIEKDTFGPKDAIFLTIKDATKASDAEEIAYLLGDVLYQLGGWDDAPQVQVLPYSDEIMVSGGKRRLREQAQKYLDKVVAKYRPRPRILIVRPPEGLTGEEAAVRMEQTARLMFGDKGRQFHVFRPRAKTAQEHLDALVQEVKAQPRRLRRAASESERRNGTSERSKVQRTKAVRPCVLDDALVEVRAALAGIAWEQTTVESVEKETPAASQPAGGEAPAAEGERPTPDAPFLDVIKPIFGGALTTPTTAESAPEGEETAELPEGVDPLQLMMGMSRKQIEEAGLPFVAFDPDRNVFLVRGNKDAMEDFQYLMTSLEEQLEDLPTPPDIRVLRCEYISVDAAKTIIETMFNGPQKKAVAKTAAQKKKEAEAKKKKAEAAGKESKEAEKEKKGEEQESEGRGPSAGRGGFKSAMEEAMRGASQRSAGSAVPGGGRVLVHANPRDRTIIVRAKPEDFPPVIELLAKIDVPQRAVSTVRVYQLERVQAEEAERILKAVLGLEEKPTGKKKTKKGAKPKPQNQAQQIQALQAQVEALGQRGGLAEAEEIIITSDPATNRLFVAAPPEILDEIITKFIQDIDAEDVDTVEIRDYEVQFAEIDDVVLALQEVVGTGGGKGKKKKGASSGPRDFGPVVITGDPRTNRLIMKGLTSDLAKLEPLLKKLDVELAGEEGEVQLYKLTAAEAESLASTLTAMYPEKDAKGELRVLVSADSGTNTLLVKATPKLRDVIAAQIEEMEQGAVAGRKPQTIIVQQADAEALAALLTEAFGGSGKKGKDRVRIVGSKSARTMVVTAPPDVFVQIKTMAAELDQPEMNYKVRLVRFEHADAGEVAEQMKAVMTQLAMGSGKGRKGGGGMPQLAMTPDPRTNSLIVVGDPAVLMMADQVKETVDIAPGDTPPNINLIEVTEGTNVVSLAETLAQVINDTEQQKSQAQPSYKPKMVTITGDPLRNVLIVGASPSQFTEVERLAKILQGPPVSSFETRIIDIGGIAPGDLERVLNQILYPEELPPPGGGRASGRTSGRPRTNVRRTSGSRRLPSSMRRSTPPRPSRTSRSKSGARPSKASRSRRSSGSRRGTSVRSRKGKGASRRAAPARK